MPEVGKSYMFKFNDEFWLGEVVESYAPYIVRLKNASWIGQTGRLNEFLRNGRTEEMEIEFFGDWTMQWSGYMLWNHKLFLESV